jgi:hypothetical protein
MTTLVEVEDIEGQIVVDMENKTHLTLQLV